MLNRDKDMKLGTKLIMQVIFLCSVLSACSIANSLRMMSANNNTVPVWQTSEKKAEQNIQAYYIGEKPYIKLRINNKEDALFLIDTGASFSMIFDTPTISKLTFKKGYSLAVAGWGEGEDTLAYQTQLSSIHLGDIKFSNVNVAYIPISTSQYYLTEEEAIFDGVIGHDLMRHFVWTFDKANERVSVSSKKINSLKSDVSLAFKTSLSKISIPATFRFNDKDEIKRNIVIDTGSRHYIKMNTAFAKNKGIELPETSITAADFGMSGKASHQRVTIPIVNLGHLTLPNVKVNLIKSDDEDDWWIVGSALLNQFVTIIDYPNNTFTIRPYAHETYNTKYNLAGLDLRKLRNGRLLVRYVYPDLPADLASITAGLVLVSIDGKETTNISEQDWLEMANTPTSYELCFEKDLCKIITTQGIEGYSAF